uniref:CSON000802 protein n=1 Tax=Culicoides sonorensis TaxID=179676 RepID=A0A336L679_CULSO
MYPCRISNSSQTKELNFGHISKILDSMRGEIRKIATYVQKYSLQKVPRDAMIHHEMHHIN